MVWGYTFEKNEKLMNSHIHSFMNMVKVHMASLGILSVNNIRNPMRSIKKPTVCFAAMF